MIKNIIDLDKNLFLFLNNLGSETWDYFWIFISDKTWMFSLLIPIILFYYYKYEGRQAIYGIITLIICISLTDLVHVHLFKNLFMRLRPCWDPDIAPLTRILVDKGGEYGFVSGHAANSAALVSFFLFYFKHIHNFVKYGLIMWVLFVSYSRIYLGKHYPLDVVFGIMLGFLIGFGIFKIYTLYIKKNIIKWQ